MFVVPVTVNIKQSGASDFCQRENNVERFSFRKIEMKPCHALATEVRSSCFCGIQSSTLAILSTCVLEAF